jgi:glycosyltransferase 2 family protein
MAATEARSGHRAWLLRAAATAVLSLALLAIAFHDVHPGRVLAIVSAIHYRYLALALLLDGVIFVLKALKWQCVFQSVKRLPVSAFFSAIAVGSLSMSVLPFRLDELVRTFYFARKHGVPQATVLGTLVAERVVDTTALVVALALVLVSVGADDRLTGAGVLLLIVAIAGAYSVVLLARNGTLTRIVSRLLPARFPARARALDLCASLVQGLSAFPRGGRIFGLAALVAAEWAVTVAYMRLVLSAFDLRLPLAGDLALVTAGYLSFAIPAAPGSLGVFEFLVKGSLAHGFSLEPDVAMSGALVLHFMLVVPISLVGAAILLRDGVSLLRLREMAQPPAAVEPDGRS